GHVLKRALGRDVTTAAADHDRELAFEIEELRHRRADELALMADQRVGETNEHAGLLGQLAPGLGRVRAVVYAGAKNLFRIRDGRQPCDVGELAVGLGAVDGLSDLVERGHPQGIAQARVTAAEALVQGDYTVTSHDAEARFAIRDIAREPHSKAPS